MTSSRNSAFDRVGDSQETRLLYPARSAGDWLGQAHGPECPLGELVLIGWDGLVGLVPPRPGLAETHRRSGRGSAATASSAVGVS